MSVHLKEIASRALELSESDRIDLICELLSSLEDETATEVHQAWEAEIARRVEEIRSGSVQGKPALQVLAEIRARYQ